MKVLDDIYCGVQHDIPTAKECYRAINKDSNGGWRSKTKSGVYSSPFDFGENLATEDFSEYDEEEEALKRGCSSNWEER